MPHAAYRPLPLGSVLPEGWLKTELRKQAKGFTGKQPEFCFPFDRHCWEGQDKGQDRESRNGTVAGGWWYPWEQLGYWTDGAYQCARMLGDEKLRQRALGPIRYTATNPIDGWFLGSPSLLKADRKPGRWPHAPFFKAMAAGCEVENDPSIAEAMRQHYLHDTVDYTGGHEGSRERVHIETLLWCYTQTGDTTLLDKALFIWHSIPEKDILHLTADKRISMHGVTFAELSKLAAIIYLYTGDEKALQVSTAMVNRVEKHHMLVDGIPSATEYLAGTSAIDGHETCDVVEFNWSWGYLLMASGEGKYADSIERGLFNAGLGSIRKDGKGVQYISCPNQVIIGPNSCQVGWVGTAAAMYGPNSDHRPKFKSVTACCAANVSRMIPNYVARMWMDDRNGGLAATLYGPCRVSAKVGADRTPVEIVEKTGYPFSEGIEFQVNASGPVKFPLHLRIPTWCKAAQLAVNGKTVDLPAIKNGFITLERTFAPGDTVRLDLPMELASRQISGGVALEKGPIVFSLKIQEDWTSVVDPSFEITNNDFPMWGATAGTPWNYALALDSNTPLLDQIEFTSGEVGEDPWAHPPVSLKVPVRLVEGWKLWDRTGRFNINKVDTDVSFQTTPKLPDPQMMQAAMSAPVPKVSFIPLGSTHLRTTIFPISENKMPAGTADAQTTNKP